MSKKKVFNKIVLKNNNNKIIKKMTVNKTIFKEVELKVYKVIIQIKLFKLLNLTQIYYKVLTILYKKSISKTNL